jgi:glutathione synthase/RimK-type ligase-like ATP-grasp enzyme
VTRHIALAICDALLPDGDQGDLPLVAALQSLGLKASTVSWSDPHADWDSFDLTILRSTWDYTVRRSEFLKWLPRVPALHNPAPVVAMNTDKIYLRELAEAGLPVVPTYFASPGEPVELPAGGEFVVKPSVGAGSRGAGRFDADQPGDRERALEHAQRLHAAGRTVLVQPYLVGVDTALVFVDGEFSHAIRKGRMLHEGAAFSADGPSLYVEENISSRTPSSEEQATAARILGQLTPDGPLLYARIDLLPSPAGPVLVEAELTEPSLFLEYQPGTADRLAHAILGRLA